MSIERFFELCSENAFFEWWQMLLIGLFFGVCNSGIFLAAWFVRVGITKKCGYPKRNAKNIKKIFQQYTVIDRFLLFKLVKNAQSKNPMLYITLICHYISFLGYLTSMAGFIFAMITLADGWAVMLMICGTFFTTILTVLIEFIPHLIWVPSERKRYGTR